MEVSGPSRVRSVPSSPRAQHRVDVVPDPAAPLDQRGAGRAAWRDPAGLGGFTRRAGPVPSAQCPGASAW